jgi:hypothetical protein
MKSRTRGSNREDFNSFAISILHIKCTVEALAAMDATVIDNCTEP